MQEIAVTQVRTFQGAAPVRVVPVAPAPSVVFAIAAEFLNQEQLQQVKKSNLDFYTASKGKLPTRLALLNPELSGVVGPVKPRAQLTVALKEMDEAQAPTGSAPPLRLFSTLGGTLQPLGGEWTIVVFTGDFPALPDELTRYAVALLSSHIAANRQRLSVWNLGSSDPAFLSTAVSQS